MPPTLVDARAMVSTHEFTFPGHSGYGNQVQALLAALFLSRAANRRVVVPPLLSSGKDERSASLAVSGGIAGRRCTFPASPRIKHEEVMTKNNSRLIDRRKATLLAMAEVRFGAVCQGEHGADERRAVDPERSWAHFSFTAGFAARCYRCTERPVCKTLHATLLHKEPELLATTRCANGTKELTPAQTPSCAEIVRIVATHRTSRMLCLGPLNDRFYTHILPKCASSFPLARALAQFGLPLGAGVRDALPWARPSSCRLCLYARVQDGKESSQRSRRKLMASIERRLKKLAPHGPVEIVVNCKPWHECEAAFRNLTARRWIILHPAHEAELASLRSMGLAPGNAAVVYDQVRCARCQQVEHFVGHGNRMSEQSSFLQQIQRLHARFARGLEFGRADMEDALRHDGAEVLYGGDFPPQENTGRRAAFLDRYFPELLRVRETDGTT